MNPIRCNFYIFLLIFLFGCSFSKKEDLKERPVEKLYQNAKENLDSGNYTAAIKAFEALQARYPYGRFAQQAQLNIAYAQYKEGNREEAVSAADSFIKEYPHNPATDYAYYLKGLANSHPDFGILRFLVTTDLSARDPQATKEAFDAFKDLIERFPNSRYADDAKQRMQKLINNLGQHELAIAYYYLRRGAPLAAVNRAKYAITTYPNSTATEEALAIMAHAYEQLNLPVLQKDTVRLLETNFPHSPYLKHLARKKAWWKWW